MDGNEIILSWQHNAKNWIDLLDRKGIGSRRITNQAIVQTVCSNLNQGAQVLDLGCGEGWLTRALSGEKNFDVIGFDATKELIAHAKQQSENEFHVVSYQDIIDKKETTRSPFDGIVCNYCLYQNAEVEILIRTLHDYLLPTGKLFIQTIHPYFLIESGRQYKSQWIENAWDGLDGLFTHPHAWFARTLETWVEVFKRARYDVHDLIEPCDEEGRLKSIIFVLTPQRISS